MGFFTSDLNLAEEVANPKVTQASQVPAPGVSALSATTPVAGDPLTQLAQAMSGTGGAGFGATDSNLMSDMQSILNRQGGYVDYIGPGAGTVGDFQPMPRTVEGPTVGGDSDGDAFTTDDPYGMFGEQADWYRARDILATPDWLSRTAKALIPGYGMLSTAQQLGLGINPFKSGYIGDEYVPQFFDWYEGPGSEIASEYDIGAGEQRDMLIEQEFDFWDSPEERAAFFADEPEPTTVEHVVEPQGTITPVVVSDGDTITAGGYTWDTDDWGSVEEAQEETGIGTAEWDPSHEDFSWDDDGGDSGGDSGGGGSYIATAATQALGEEGLKVFEDWRDYMFKALPTFTASFGRYRATAPKIVKAIDAKENSDNIYGWIWDMHLKPIFDLIKEDKDSEKALKDYKIMVRELQNKFLKEDK